MLGGVCTNRSSLVHAGLTVKRHRGVGVKPRKIYQVGGWSPPTWFGVHNSSIDNLERGMLERVYFVKGADGFTQPPRPLEGVYSQRLGYFRDLLVSHLPSTTPCDILEFPNFYRGRKQTIYEQAALSLLLQGVQRADADLKTFVKAEKINFTSKGDPAPRVIQPRDPRYNVEVGRHLRVLEPQLYKAIAKIFHDVTIFKGLNAVESGRLMAQKWNRYRKPVAIGLDASRFDQHVSVQALQWEHSIYNRVFKSPLLRKLLSWQLKNRGKGFCKDGRIKYTVDGCRMSGDMNTALGNCIIMCALVHAYCKYAKIPNFSLANNGDDCVVIMESRYLHRFQRNLTNWFVEMGFTMKVEDPVYELERIEFCQTHPVYDGSDYIMVRNAPVSLAKDCISIKPLDSEKAYRKWIKAVGECGLSLTGGLPVYQDFYSGMIRAGGNVKAMSSDEPTLQTGMSMLAKGMDRCYRKVTDESRYSFWLAFGLMPDQQVAIEHYYATHTPVWATPKIGSNDLLPDWWC